MLLYTTDSTGTPLMHSNEPPTNSQIAYFRDRVEEKETEIKKLDAKRRELNRKINKEEAERTMYLRFLSPFRRIPDNILREIFFACLPQDLIACTPSRQHAPLILARVCSRWRTIALGTATLWTNVVIQHNSTRRSNFDQRGQNRAEMCVQAWTQLSQRVPLQIYMDLGSVHHGLLKWADRILRPLAPRIRHLTLRGEGVNHLLRGPLFSEWNMFPELQTVIIEDADWAHLDVEDEEIFVSEGRAIFPGSAKLHSADITMFPSSARPLVLPHQNITRLHTYDPRRMQGVADLKCYANLRYLRLTNLEIENHGHPGSGPRPTLPTVEFLSLVYENAVRPIQRIGTLEGVEFPCLKALHLSSPRLDPSTNMGHVIWYTHPRTVFALSKLTSLDLDKPMGSTHHHALNVLKLTPKLRRLHIALVGNRDMHGRYSFTNSLLNSHIAPVLEELELNVATIGRQAIYEAIASRASLGMEKLRRLVVYGRIQSGATDEAIYPAITGVEVREERATPGELPATSSWNEWSHGLTLPKVARR